VIQLYQRAQQVIFHYNLRKSNIRNIVKLKAAKVHLRLSTILQGNIDADSITFEPCRDLVDEWVVVDEAPISAAMHYVLKNHHKVIEGAAGLALAAYLQTKDKYKGQVVAIIFCGGNLDWKTLKSLVNK
jgi:threonine dehydratase